MQNWKIEKLDLKFDFKIMFPIVTAVPWDVQKRQKNKLLDLFNYDNGCTDAPREAIARHSRNLPKPPISVCAPLAAK